LPLTKPKQIQHTQSALVIDDFITPRVTSLGYSADLNSEEIEELGNANIVEILDDTPTISITVDVNDHGSLETIATLSNLIRKPYGNTDYQADSTYWEIDATDFEESAIDLLNPVKTTSSQQYSVWLNNCQIQSLSSTYSVDGFATESISLENSAQYVFINGWKYARVLVPSFIYKTGSHYDTTTAFTTHVLAADNAPDATFHFNDLGETFVGQADSTALYLTKNGVIQSSVWSWDTTVLVSHDPSQLTWDPESDRLRVVVMSESIQTFAGPTATGRAGLRKGNSRMYFWDAGDDAPGSAFFTGREPSVGDSNYSKRIQSISIDVTWNRDELEQLGEHEPYDRGVESTEITATVSAIGTDVELFAIASGYTKDGTGWVDDDNNEMKLTDFQNATNLAVRIDIFNTTDITLHTDANRAKYILLTGGKVTSYGNSVDVPGRQTTDLTITFNAIRWYGDKIIANRSAV